MADTYAQAISMIADWLPFLAEAEAGLQTKMDKQTGDGPVTPPAAPVPAITAPVLNVPPPSTAATDAEVWNDDTFDGWTEDMTTDTPDEEGLEVVVDEADEGDGGDEGDNLFGDEGNKETTPPEESDLLDFDLDEPKAEPAPPAKFSHKKKPAADEDDWLASVEQ
jgi:hypothetical protein